MNRIVATALVALTCAAAPVIAAPAAPSSPVSTNPETVQKGTYAVEPSHTRVQFSVSHMGLTDWYGDFTGVTGTLHLDPAQPASSTVDITIPVASVSTTNAKLDGELKSADWFNATAFPTMRFVSTSVTAIAPNKATIAGKLTFHGVTRSVMLDTTFNGAGVNPLSKAYTTGFNAVTIINRSDFGVKTYLPLIGDAVTIRISAAFERQPK